MIRLVASGQSNALGRDNSIHPSLSPRLVVWDNANDIDSLDELGTGYRRPQAQHPPFARGALSPLAFAASAIADQMDDDVSLVLVAKGATPAETWCRGDLTPGPMYRRLHAVAERAGARACDAFLWHQGEADDHAADAYAPKLLQLVCRLRTDGIISDLAPIVIGETAAKWTAINGVLRTLPDLDPAIRFVQLADLPTYDDVHFRAVVGPEIGRRYADAFASAKSASA